MFSIGNEIPDGSTTNGLQIARALAEKVRSLDDSRYVTQAVTGILVGGQELFDDLRATMAAATRGRRRDRASTPSRPASATSCSSSCCSPVVDAKTAEAFAHLDVAGYNYMESRYPGRRRAAPRAGDRGHRDPSRPPSPRAGPRCSPIPASSATSRGPGWDYLGEAGIGRTDYRADAEPAPFHGEFPWRTAWCGDIDITGHRRPQSYLREIVFGLRGDPVRRGAASRARAAPQPPPQPVELPRRGRQLELAWSRGRARRGRGLRRRRRGRAPARRSIAGPPAGRSRPSLPRRRSRSATSPASSRPWRGPAER